MLEESKSAKRQLRDRVRARRAALTGEQRADAGAALAENIATLVTERAALSLTCYLPLRDEPDTRPFLAWAREQGLDVLLPSARDDGRLDWIRDGGHGYSVGRYGILEPHGEALEFASVSGVDLMLIPACAVGMDGMRLGWGRGYFDRNLSTVDRLPPVFAVVYDSELCDTVPSESHDVPVDGVITPERIVTFTD